MKQNGYLKMQPGLRMHLNEPQPYGLNCCCFYPNQEPLKVQLASLLGVKPANVLLDTGADRILDLIMRATTRTEVVTLHPDYSRYRDHIANGGHAWVRIPIGPHPFTFPSRLLLETLVESTRTVILSVVANPTGLALPMAIIEEIRDRAPQVQIIIDEVYSAFLGANMAPLAATDPMMLSVGSLSKLGYPGVRLGWAIGTLDTLVRIGRFTSPYAVSSISLRESARFLSRAQDWPTIIAKQTNALEILTRELESRGIQVARGAANFLLARFGVNARHLRTELEARGVYIHEPVDSELDGWMRVSTPRAEEVRRFLHVLDRLMA